MSGAAAPPALDALGRTLRDLRVSITDRCNFRCTYCMPRERFGPDHVFLPHDALLSFDEIVRVVDATTHLGVRKVRLTGGEPLVRGDVPALVARLAALPPIDDLAMTTNASLLAPIAGELRSAGLDRVTISLDALDPDVFRRMSDTRVPLAQVLRGVDAALAAGFDTVKLNCVVRRGVNEDQILPLAAFGRAHGVVVRFIEYMDVGATNGWRRDEVVPSAEVLAGIAAVHPIEPVDAAADGAVARRWRYRDGGGEIGVVSSVTEPFCSTCVRARLSAVGELYTCLFATRGTDVRAWLRDDDVSDAELRDRLGAVWGRRDDRYSELRGRLLPLTSERPRVEMSYIGG